MRISKDFALPGRARVQVLLEVFNLTNAINEFVANTSITTNQDRYQATFTQGTGLYTFKEFPSFGLTNSYASAPDPRQLATPGPDQWPEGGGTEGRFPLIVGH